MVESAAVEAMRALLDDPSADVVEPTTEAGARAAAEELAARFAALPRAVTSALDGARAGAETLSGDPLQGLSELVQNADDAGASEIDLILEPGSLTAIHDGRPLALRDVVALSLPWLTTKAGDSDAIGRFGIGLMTLRTLSSTLEVHSGPHHLRFGAPLVDWVDDVSDLRGSVDLAADTAMIVRFDRASLSEEDLLEWIGRWDDSALLFCRHVRTIRVGPGLRELGLSWSEPAAWVPELGGEDVEGHVRQAEDRAGRRWSVYTSDVPVTVGVERAGKRRTEHTPIGVAIAHQVGSTGRLYAGLPVAPVDHQMLVDAQFDPVSSRQGLAPTAWNRMLCDLVPQVWAAAVVHAFALDPAATWASIPLPTGGEQDGGITGRLVAAIVAASRSTVAASARIPVDGRLEPIARLAVEDETLEPILTAAQVAFLAGTDAVIPATARDPEGRWRNVVDDWFESSETDGRFPFVPLEEAFDLFGSEHEPTPDAAVELAAAAVSAGLDDLLAERAWVPLADGSRTSPPEAEAPWLLVTEDSALTQALGIGSRVTELLSAGSPSATAVRAWLEATGALPDDPTSGAIERLARAGRSGRGLDGPCADDALVALRDAFEQMDAAKRERLGRQVGAALVLEGFEWSARGRAKPVRVEGPVRITEAYLPPTIDGGPNTFAVAADQTPGLSWVAPRYANVLRSPRRREGLGARRFLRLLGAEVCPRITSHPGNWERFKSDRRYGVPLRTQDSPAMRTKAMQDARADFTLEDRLSSDLSDVLENIAADTRALRRRDRAAAIIEVLGRSWARLEDDVEVTAAYAYGGWQTRGPTRAWWLWEAGEIRWLDNAAAEPSSPRSLVLRSAETVAVHGPGAASFLHRSIPAERREVLTSLGVTGEASSRGLVDRLRRLRDGVDSEDDELAAAAIAYQALAQRLTTRGRVHGDLSPEAMRKEFGRGTGLIRTNLGWQPPAQTFRGDPVFGDRRAHAPNVPGVDRLWAALGLAAPSWQDHVKVVRELAREDLPLSEADGAVLIECLRALATLAEDEDRAKAMRRQLAALPLLTADGWSTA
ncbi:MAG TPA: hypothetical protein VK507_11980, partial [Iamia sp.]|nr:hypothetical protein [Iamia sp.]